MFIVCCQCYKSSPQFVVDGLVLHDSNPRHLLEHPLAAESLKAVDLELGIPDVLQALGRYVDLLKKKETGDKHEYRGNTESIILDEIC